MFGCLPLIVQHSDVRLAGKRGLFGAERICARCMPFSTSSPVAKKVHPASFVDLWHLVKESLLNVHGLNASPREREWTYATRLALGSPTCVPARKSYLCARKFCLCAREPYPCAHAQGECFCRQFDFYLDGGDVLQLGGLRTTSVSAKHFCIQIDYNTFCECLCNVSTGCYLHFFSTKKSLDLAHTAFTSVYDGSHNSMQGVPA